MENASKALLIAGAILLCILIIAIGMFIYNGAQSTITESITTMSTQEVESFNNQFIVYEGLQDGTKIKSLMGTLISNASTYKDENTRIPGVVIDRPSIEYGEVIHATIPENGKIQDYINELAKIRNKIQTKHEYWIEMSFQDNGLVDYITITYNPASPASPTHRAYGVQPPS